MTFLLAGLGISEFSIYWAWELWPLVLMDALVTTAALPALRSRGLRAWAVERPAAGGLLDPLGLLGKVALAVAPGLVVFWILHQNQQFRDVSRSSTVSGRERCLSIRTPFAAHEKVPLSLEQTTNRLRLAFYALAAGAILYVVGQLWNQGQRHLGPHLVLGGIVAGFLAGFASDLDITWGGG